MGHKKAKISQNDIERYLAGHLSTEAQRTVEEQLDGDPHFAATVEARRREREAFLHDARRKNFATLLKDAHPSPSPSPSRSMRSLWPVGVAAAAVCSVFIMVTVPSSMNSASRSSQFAVKGGLTVQAAVLGDGTPQVFDSMQPLYPGDQIALRLEDAAGGWVTVLMEEESGKLFKLYDPHQLGQLPPGKHQLPGSIQLDEKLGRERLYILLSEHAPEPQTWMREIESAHSAAGFDHTWLPERGTRLSTLEYQKVRRP